MNCLLLCIVPIKEMHMAIIKWKDIEAAYQKEWKDILHDYYVIKHLTPERIVDKIERRTGIEYSPQQIRKWLHKYNLNKGSINNVDHNVQKPDSTKQTCQNLLFDV